MATVYRDSVEAVKRGIRGAAGSLVLLAGLSFLVGCTGTIFTKTAGNDKPKETPSVVTVKELSVSTRPIDVALDQNGPGIMVTLPYEPKGGAVAGYCLVNSLSNLVWTSRCTCAEGVCRVGIQAPPDFYGQGSFAFRLIDETYKVNSNYGNVHVKIRQVTVKPIEPLKNALVMTDVPLEALVRNSDDIPVSGVGVTWEVVEESGSLSACTEVSDKQGLVKCKWTLGSKAGVQRVKISVFGDKNNAKFETIAKPDSAVKLGFGEYHREHTAGDLFVGVLVQDKYGNQVTDSKGTLVTLTFDGKTEGVVLGGKTKAKVVSGKADLIPIIEKVGVYTLRASAPDLKDGISEKVTILAGPAAQLVFDVQPGGGPAGTTPWIQQPRLVMEDYYGNRTSSLPISAPNPTVVTISLNSSGTLFGSASVGAVEGVAAFRDLSVGGLAGGGYTLKAESPDLGPATSAPFTITYGEIHQLGFVTQPGGGPAGVPWVQQPKVVVQDAFGNTVPSASNEVYLLTYADSGFTQTQVSKIQATDGEASFSGLSLSKVGEYSLMAVSPGLEWGKSEKFLILPGKENKLKFVEQPSGGTAGTPWTPPKVAIQDVYGNTVTTSSAKVTLTFVENSEGGNSPGTTMTVQAANGIATFTGLSITKAKKYTLKASSSDLQEVVSEPFDIKHGPATKLVFTTQPGGAVAGEKLNPQPVVTIQDAHGNTVTTGADSTVILTMALGSGTGLSGNLDLATTVLGVATWTDLSIADAGEKTLKVSKPDRTGSGGTGALTEDSISFNVNPGAPKELKLVFVTSPGGGVAGAPWDQQPKVAIQDASGNTVTDSSVEVTLALGANPSQGVLSATASGATKVRASNGIATFAGLSIDKAGVKYTLKASSPDLPKAEAVSQEFDIAAHGPATKLVFTTQPGGGVAGVPWAQQPKVAIQDASGNTVTDSSVSVTLAMGENPGKGTLLGAATVQTMNGVATFTGLSIDKAGEKYTLKASSPGLPKAEAVSQEFDIAAHGPATKLVFTTQPGGGVAGVPWVQQPKVAIQDASGNTVTDSSAEVTLALGANPSQGVLSATASGATKVRASNGIATFAGLSIDKTGVKYTLKASSPGLPEAEAVSQEFDIAAHGPATKLVFTTQPGGGVAGVPWAQQPKVAIQDASGNTVTDSSAEVTLALGANPSQGVLSATASGATKVRASNGIATFAGLSIDKTGVKYTLKASSPGLPEAEAVSQEFDIAAHGPATKLVFTTQPGGAVAGEKLNPQPVVTIQDAHGNTVTTGADSTVTLTMALGSGTGLLRNLDLTTTVLGVATWTDLSIADAGEKTLKVSKPDCTGSGGTGTLTEDSISFNVNPGAPKELKLVFVTSPGGGVAGAPWDQQPKVAIQDASGNTVTDSSVEVTLALGANPSQGVLSATASGATKVRASNGIATFAGLSIDKAGVKYTLKASSPDLPKAEAVSQEFDIAAHGPATKLVFTTQPGGGVAGVPWVQQPKVAIQDASGNTVTDSSAEVTLALGANPSQGVLSATASGATKVRASNGIATFAGLSIDKTGVKYTLKASSPGLPEAEAVSQEFDIAAHGPATKLVFTTQPGGAVAGEKLNPQPVVTIQDAHGNTVTTGADSTVTLTMALGSGTGLLRNLDLTTTVLGVATWTDLSIADAGEKTLKVSKPDRTGSGGTGTLTEDSISFDVNPGAPKELKLVFVTSPGGGVAGAPWVQQPKVAIQDASGNTVTDSSVSVTLAMGENPGKGTLLGAATVQTMNGVATFNGLSIDKAGEKYTLKASSPGLPEVVSGQFNMTYGAAKRLAFIQQPKGSVAGEPLSQKPIVAIQDDYGNTVKSSKASVSLDIGKGPGAIRMAPYANAVDGEASFLLTAFSIAKSGTYTLKATSKNLIETESDSFVIVHGPATKLVFTAEPGVEGAVAGEPFKKQPVVEIRDKEDNIVTSSPDASANLTIRIYDGKGAFPSSAVLTVKAVSGVGSWSGLSIDLPGNKKLSVNKEDLSGREGVKGVKALNATTSFFPNKINPAVMPTNVKASAGDKKVTLSWTISEKAASYANSTYDIYREEKETGFNGFPITNNKTNTYVDTSEVENGKTYYYKIRVNASDRTPISDLTESAVAARPLSTPSITSVVVDDKAGSGALMVSWDPSIGASDYAVRYSTTKGKAAEGTEACTVKAPAPPATGPLEPLEPCMVKNLTSGGAYYVVVRATNEKSGQVDSAEMEGIPREAPTLKLTAGDKQVTPVFASEGATSFDLSYGEKPGEYSTQKKGAISGEPILDLKGAVYYFKVVANFPKGSLSSVEKTVQLSVEAPASGNQVKASSFNLSWQNVPGATGYIIKYRTSLNEDPVTLVDDLPANVVHEEAEYQTEEPTQPGGVRDLAMATITCDEWSHGDDKVHPAAVVYGGKYHQTGWGIKKFDLKKTYYFSVIAVTPGGFVDSNEAEIMFLRSRSYDFGNLIVISGKAIPRPHDYKPYNGQNSQESIIREGGR